MEFKTVEVVYFVVVWIIAFGAGLWRTIRDHRYDCWWDCIAVGMVGGFYGFATVTILSPYGPDIAVNGWPYLGLAAIVGALGKEQDKIMRRIASKAIEKIFGVKIDDDEGKDK